MSLVEETGAPAPDTAPIAEALDTPAVETTEQPSLFGDEKSDDELSAIWDRNNPPRDSETGKFKSLKPVEAEPPAEGQPLTTDQPKTAEPTETAAKPDLEVPASWKADMKAKFATVPPDLQPYLLERDAEANKRISELGQQLKAYEPIGSTIDRYAENFTRNGVSVSEGIERLLQADNYLAQDPKGAIAWLAQSYGVSLSELAGATTNGAQPTELPAGVAELKAQVATLEQQLRQTANRVTGREQQEQAARTASLNTAITKFAEDKPDFDKLETEIVANINAIRALNPGLDTDKVLEQAYERAAWANPETRAARIAAEQKAQADKAAAEAKERADKARKSGEINVKGDLVKGEVPKDMDEELRVIAAKHYGSARR